ncbi:MAG: SLC13 family permease [Candidatus Promineifilaceae bacterium]
MFSLSALITLVILTAAVVLFLTNRLRADIVALLVLVSLGVTGVLTAEETFSGFSRSAVITIMAIFIIARGLTVTGVSELVGELLLRMSGQSETRLVILVMACGAFLSLVMNNIAAASVLLPAVSGAAHQRGIRLSRVLMPLAFGTILGGMATLFTTVNIVMSGLLRENNLAGFGVLDFAPVGIPAVATGILYMAVIGRRFLPQHNLAEQIQTSPSHNSNGDDGSRDLTDIYRMDERLFRARIPIGSFLHGRVLANSTFREQYNLNVIALERNEEVILAPSPNIKLFSGDILILEGSLSEFQEKDIEPYLEILPKRSFQEPDLESANIVVTEVVLAPRSNLINKTLKELNFREKFGFTALAIWRAGRPIRRGMTTLTLQFGDALLLQGPRQRLHLLQSERDLIMMGQDTQPYRPERRSKMKLATAITLITLFVAATNLIPSAEVMLAGSLLMILTNCLTADEAYDAIGWKAVFLVIGMLPMGVALTKTGIAGFAADSLIQLLGGYGPYVLLIGLFTLATILVQVISGPAVIAMIGPLAIQTAIQLNINPQAVALGVALATSMAFLTPLGHPVNILVMGPGGYKFSDYFRVGLPMTILVSVVILLLLPLVRPL